MSQLVTLFFSLVFSIAAFSTVTFNGASGVSNQEKSATDGIWTLYGGIQGDTVPAACTGGTTSTCNTCATGIAAADAPCNPTGVFANTVISFNVTQSGAVTGASWHLCSTANAEVTLTTSAIGSTPATTWANVCAAVGTNTNCAASMAVTTFYLGTGTDCSNLGNEKASVKITTRRVDITAPSTYTDCPPGTPATVSGVCHFALFPGDEKLYLEEAQVYADSAYPATGTAGYNYKNIFFFFTNQVAGENDAQTFARITTDIVDPNLGISNSSISVDDNGTTPSGAYIDKLDNDTRYCFRVANQDAAGNIERITPANYCVAAPCDDVCNTPSEVVGLLSNKKCFIATAAFGSEMDKHVQTLRQFRNEFMATHWLGRKMVKAYYKISPPLADWISHHETARALVRGFLWPILGWAALSLKYGWGVVLLPFVLAFSSVLLVRRRRVRV